MKYLVLTLTILAFPGVIFAHASGMSWEHEVNGYRIDIGYDPEAHIVGATDVFDISLLDVQTERHVALDEIWVRIARDGRTVLATGLRSDPVIKSTLLYAFEQEGDYVLSASFRDGGETLAEGEFAFVVAGKEGNSAYRLVLAFFVAGAIFIVVGIRSFYTKKHLSE